MTTKQKLTQFDKLRIRTAEAALSSHPPVMPGTNVPVMTVERAKEVLAMYGRANRFWKK